MEFNQFKLNFICSFIKNAIHTLQILFQQFRTHSAHTKLHSMHPSPVKFIGYEIFHCLLRLDNVRFHSYVNRFSYCEATIPAILQSKRHGSFHRRNSTNSLISLRLCVISLWLRDRNKSQKYRLNIKNQSFYEAPFKCIWSDALQPRCRNTIYHRKQICQRIRSERLTTTKKISKL